MEETTAEDYRTVRIAEDVAVTVITQVAVVCPENLTPFFSQAIVKAWEEGRKEGQRIERKAWDK